jgi:DNA-binding IclR family transcriptional regulator
MTSSADVPESAGAIERALRALQAVAEHGEFTPKDLARDVGVPTSTAYRLIQSLIALNFVEKSGRGTYRVGRQLYRLAALIVDQCDYESLAHPFLVELTETFHETAAFALYLPNECAFTIVDAILSKHPLQYVVEKYSARPMIQGALGRSMLPFLPEEDVQTALARQGPPREVGGSTVTRADLAKEFEAVHRLGCFVATSPNAFGTNGTAAAVFNSKGQLIGSLGITVPTVRYEPEMQPQITEAVVAAARGLSTALGYGPDTSRRRLVPAGT